jgi:general secretion pathway protein G
VPDKRHYKSANGIPPSSSSKKGFTLLELLLVMAIIGTLAAIAIPHYRYFKERINTKTAISEVKILELEILSFFVDHGGYPDSLADIGRGNFPDPWGNPYKYLKIAGGNIKGKGDLRKDHSMVPVNSDYDLYSMGADGDSKRPFTAKASWDDIVRCGNGNYIGLVSNY